MGLKYEVHQGPAPRLASAPVEDPKVMSFCRNDGPRFPTHAQRRVYEALGDFFAQDDMWVQIPNELLADRADTHEATIIRHLEWLEDIGKIQIEHVVENGEQRPNAYRFYT